MGYPAGRPPSVWITQVLLVLSSVAFGVALLISVLRCLWPAQRGSCPSPVTLPELVLGLAMLACAFLAFRGLQTRRRYGQLLPDPLQACGHPFGQLTDLCGYSSYPQLLWAIAADLLPSLLVSVLAFRLLFGEAARCFFRTTSR